MAEEEVLSSERPNEPNRTNRRTGSKNPTSSSSKKAAASKSAQSDKKFQSSSSSSRIIDRYASGYDFLFVNRDIYTTLFADVVRCVSSQRKNSKVVLILVTHGGLANEAYRVSRYLQSVYEEVVVFAPSLCKSAGTLIVASAHSVVISPFGEIGPLDVQLIQRDEIAGRRSGLTTRSALEDLKTHSWELFEHFMLRIVTSSGGAVSFRLAADISAQVSSELLSRVYEQINPEALGQDFRDLTVATRYCERLNKRFNNLKPGAIQRLVHRYPSHDFVIDLEEARELFERVDLPTPTLLALMGKRMIDMIVAKTGKASLVEMLTIDAEVKTDENAEDDANPRDDGEQNEPSADRRNGD